MRCCLSAMTFVPTVLSDANKRFLYDVGAYDSDDDDDNVVKLLVLVLSFLIGLRFNRNQTNA